MVVKIIAVLGSIGFIQNWWNLFQTYPRDLNSECPVRHAG